MAEAVTTEAQATPVAARDWLYRLALLFAVLAGLDFLQQIIFGAHAVRLGPLHLGERRIQVQGSILAVSVSLAMYLRSGFAYRWRPLHLALLAFALFMANTRYGGSGDTFPAGYLDFQIVRGHTVTFDGASYLPSSDKPLPYWFSQVNGHIYSRYPIATPLLALPVYIPAALGTFDPNTAAVHDLEKTSASLMTALSAALLLLVLRRLVSERAAVLGAALYTAGTPAMTILGLGLWQHTGAALSLSAGLYGLFVIERAWLKGLVVGVAAGMIVACRPLDVILAAPLGLALLVQNRRAGIVAALSGCVPVLLAALYNALVFGHAFSTGYGSEANEGWTTPFLTGVSGLLFSPARGLFFFCPMFLLAVWPTLRTRSPHRTSLWILGSGAVALILVMSKWWAWHGGYSFGPRMLSESMPIWTLALGFGIDWAWTTQPRRRLFQTLAAVSVACHFITIYAPIEHDGYILVAALSRGVWTVKSYPPIALLVQHGWLKMPPAN